MKLLANTYQVSYHEPILWPPADPETNINAYPKHMRVRATNAVDAIDFVHAKVINGHNDALRAGMQQTLGGRLTPETEKFFEGRDHQLFDKFDFPIMEVKVVA